MATNADQRKWRECVSAVSAERVWEGERNWGLEKGGCGVRGRTVHFYSVLYGGGGWGAGVFVCLRVSLRYGGDLSLTCVFPPRSTLCRVGRADEQPEVLAILKAHNSRIGRFSCSSDLRNTVVDRLTIYLLLVWRSAACAGPGLHTFSNNENSERPRTGSSLPAAAPFLSIRTKEKLLSCNIGRDVTR